MPKRGRAAMTLCFVIALSNSRLLSFQTNDSPTTFENPLVPSGPDPWVTFHDGFYYYMNTTGRNLTIWKGTDPTELRYADRKVIWRPPEDTPYSSHIWAPELHFMSGRWYIYFAADDGRNENHRIWVLENSSPDPLEGEWVMKGKVSDESDKWAIDPTVFEIGGQVFMAWSGWPGDRNGEQDIYLARMRDPWTVEGKRLRLSAPRYAWEKPKPPKGAPHVRVNEGPEALIHDGHIFLIYSAGGCWSDNSQLGMLRANVNTPLMQASSWTKSPLPVFGSSAERSAFGVGHNGFFTSPDGTQQWLIYHARTEANEGCTNRRAPRAGI